MHVCTNRFQYSNSSSLGNHVVTFTDAGLFQGFLLVQLLLKQKWGGGGDRIMRPNGTEPGF